MSSAAPLVATGLRKSYGEREVVCGLDFALQPGECFGLLGPNGAGKTTTLRLCLGLTDPDGGSITVLGKPVPQQAREARMRIGVVPQFDNLDPDFTIRENLLIFGRYFDIADQVLRARIPDLLEFAGLSSRADARIQTLSGGMKRRLTLARALINDPELIFLDEPTTGLDPQARHVIWERLRNLLKQGKTEVSTPYEIPKTGQQVGVGFWGAGRGWLTHHMVLQDGVVANYQIITPSTINASPRDPWDHPGPYEEAVLNTPLLETFSDPKEFKGIWD